MVQHKRQRIPKVQSKMDNPEKLATWGTQDKKNNTVCVGHHDTSTNNMVCFPDHRG